MTWILRLGLVTIGFAWACLPSHVAQAQATPDPTKSEAPVPEEADGIPEEVDAGPVVAPPPGIEAIEVTGESLDTTNVQDEAQAVTAFDTGELDRLQIGNVDRLALNVPGLHVGQQGQNAIITLRGVGTENSSITGETGVAFHVDGVYYGSPAAARTAFFDIQSIEVKRGPQGFVGGKNSTSGAILVNTNDPTAEYEVRGDFTMGNYDRQRGRGVINVPIGEFLSSRLALFYEERDGYLRRDRAIPNFPPNNIPTDASQRTIVGLGPSAAAFDLDNFGLRGKLRFQPSDSLDFVLGYDYFKEGGNGPQADIVPLNAINCRDGLPIGLTPIPEDATSRMGPGGCKAIPRSVDPTQQALGSVFYPVVEDLDPRKTYSDFDSSQDDRYWGWLGKAQWDAPEVPLFGATTLKLIGGFRENELNFNWDFDGSDQEIFNLFGATTVREYTSELQWSGGDRLSWQGTLFFQRQTGENRLISPGNESIPDPNRTTFPDFSSTPAYVATVNFDTEQWTKNKSYGAALHGSYALTDAVTFSLGGRWNKDHKTTYLAQRRTLEGVIFEACSPRLNDQGLPSGSDYVGRPFTQVTELTPSGFAADRLPTCGLTFRGTMWGSRLEWKPADEFLFYAGIDRGYKSGGFASGGLGTYVPEKIWAYTLGGKSEFFDQRLQLNLEGFVYNYQDMQLTLLDATKLRTENSDARMYGVELEMRASPIEGLRLQSLIAYLHTETIEYYSLDPATLGNRLQQARVTTRDRVERRGGTFPRGFAPGGESCQSAHTEVIGGQPVFFPNRRCSQFGDKNGLDAYSGNQLSRSPELKWNVSAEYDIPLGRFGTLTPGFQYAWQDDAYYRVFNRDFDLQKAYHETNASLSWLSPEETWEIRTFVNNIEDDAIKQNILISPSTFGSIPLAWYGEPRFYGAQISFKY
jgi:iron complex outermembrane receptor protein